MAPATTRSAAAPASTSLDGGSGTDTLDYSSATSVSSANLAGGSPTPTGRARASTSLSNFENITGSPGNDALFGDGGDNVLRGLGGNDFLQGGGGDDSIQGGSGNDTADFSDSAGGVTVDLAAQTALGDGTDALSSIENANGSNSADQLSGNGGPNTLNGYGGNDQIDGGGGADTIDAGLGDDSVYAKDGFVDTIACGGGNDTASGRRGGRRQRRLRGGRLPRRPGRADDRGERRDHHGGDPERRRQPRRPRGHLPLPLRPDLGVRARRRPRRRSPAGHSESLVSAAISGLTPGTTYHFQLVVTDGLGNTTLGNDQSFTTGSLPHGGPLATTLPPAAGDPQPDNNVLVGSITTNGVPTTYFFQWGTTTAYGQQTPAHQLGSTAFPVLVWDTISTKGAGSKATLHYRLVATNEFGTSFGNDVAFTLPLKSPTVILSASGLKLMKSSGRSKLLHFRRHRH